LPLATRASDGFHIDFHGDIEVRNLLL